ncbi:haloacid dehalogenase-like hydrolase [candidate division KSB1 bacterium]
MNTIALIFDFDDTLAPDSISRFLEQAGVDVPAFWRDRVDPLIAGGWDPVPALAYRLVEYSRSSGSGDRFTEEAFARFGKSLKLFPGVPALFQTMRSLVEEQSREKHIEADIEFYIISSGIGSIIRSTKIAKHFTEIWATEFHFDDGAGDIAFPKNIISFTDKTRYIFHIRKGLVGEQFRGKPFEVNRKHSPGEIRVPFERMIFVGDGYTDVPCFSLLQQNGGTAIAVYDRNRREKWGRAWGFTQTGRATNIAPSDYRRNSALHDSLIMAIERICSDIALGKRTFSA